jgi:hypothetical protein
MAARGRIEGISLAVRSESRSAGSLIRARLWIKIKLLKSKGF